MADPMQTLLGSDAGAAVVSRVNENFRRRFTPEVRTVADANAAQTTTDELLKVSATSAPRTLTPLPAATANSLFVWISAADGTNTYTIDGNASETIDGSTTKVYTAAKRLLLIPDGTGWTVFDCT